MAESRPAATLFGRGAELAMLKAALVPGGSALVLGRAGTGKSALLAAARHAALATGMEAGLTGAVERTDVTLARLLLALGAGRGAKSLGVRALQARLLRWCSEHQLAVFLDDADRASAGLLRTVRRVVLETSACVVVAGRIGPADSPDRLRNAIFPGTREIRLGPLPAAAARALADTHLGTDEALAAEIARESGRIPAAIVEMVRRHREPRYRFGSRTSWALLLADLRVENRI
jgi:hypothetical protein